MNKKGSLTLQMLVKIIIIILVIALILLVFVRQINDTGKYIAKNQSIDCTKDSDLDGVVDCVDSCPHNPEIIEGPC